MPPFAAHWRGRDVIERADMGLLSRPEIKKELALRQAKNSALIAFLKRHKQLTGSDPSVHEVIKASLQWLAQSQAETVLINLEDLWQEERRQNTPGTAGPPNWRRKARLTLEQIRESTALRNLLYEINRLRSGGSHRNENCNQ
jgi:4-alpha-glucanotransferase